MDSHDSSAPPPHPLHHHPHHQPPPYSSHHAAMLMHNPIQQPPSNNSYLLPSNSSSVVPTTSNSTIMHQQNPRFPFKSMAAAAATSAAPTSQKPLDHQFSDGGSAGGWFSAEPARKKRGRPRKYSPDNSIGLGLSPAPAAQISPAVGHVDPGSAGGGTPSSETPIKRHRGRPPGSVKKQLDALGIPGVGFTPHVITVNSGEDVASKIIAFSQEGPRTVCILSANGAICNVTLRQPATSGGTVTYEGRFEIISLSGSFPTSDSDGSQTGALIVSLAGSDGRVLGGSVAGMLKAASPVQVIVGSFVAEARKPKSRPSSNPSPNMLKFDTAGNTQASPTSGSGSSDSGNENDDDGPLPPATQPYGNAGIPVPLYSNMGWPNSIKM